MSVLTGIFYFLILVGILIFIHEGGHFIFAKLFGVRVHVFSLGMGPRLFGFKKGDTDYRISAVLIGGYVRMLGEDPGEEFNDREMGRSIQGIAPWKRIIIYAAGPTMNLIFPLFLYFFLALEQKELPPAEVAAVFENSPAEQVGLKSGDRIIAINRSPVYSFNHLVDRIQDKGGQQITLTVDRSGKTLKFPIVPEAKTGPKYGISFLRHIQTTRGVIGISGVYANTIVKVHGNVATAPEGLQTFDKIIAIDGKEIDRLVDVEKALLDAKGKTVSIRFLRLKKNLSPLLFDTSEKGVSESEKTHPRAFEKKPLIVEYTVPENWRQLSDIGLSTASSTVIHVEKGGPAEKAGLQPGDEIIGMDGKKMSIWEVMAAIYQVDEIQKNTMAHSLMWKRDGKTMSAQYKADFVAAGTQKDLGLKDDAIMPGFNIYPYTDEWRDIVPDTVPNLHKVDYGLHMAVSQTLYWSEVILDVLKSLATGSISPKAVSGPLGIGHAAAQVGKEGASAFFGFMGFVSLNLGFMNLLLPIPILDGGRLILIVTEVVMRRRLSIRIQERIMVTGAIMTIMLMVWAVIMDITRLVQS